MTSVVDGMFAPDHAARARTGRAVFCVANASHFPGAVALVNSLRLTGWGDEIVIVDCGLEPEQRSLLAREARIVPASEGPDPPQLVKVAGPLSYPTETAIVLDADMIVTRAIEPLVAEAERTGRMLAVADRLEDRFDERWGDLLGLGELRKHPYVNCGLLIVPAGVGERLFGLWRDAQAHIDLGRSLLGGGRPSDPLFFADQDVLNAVLGSERFTADELTVLDFRTAPHAPFPGLRIIDARRLRGGADEQAAEHVRQRRVMLDERDQAREQARPLQPRRLLGIRSADRDVITAAGARGAAVEHVALGGETDRHRGTNTIAWRSAASRPK